MQSYKHSTESLYQFRRVGDPFFTTGAFEGAANLDGAVFDDWCVTKRMDDGIEARAVVAFARGGFVVAGFEGEAEDFFAKGCQKECGDEEVQGVRFEEGGRNRCTRTASRPRRHWSTKRAQGLQSNQPSRRLGWRRRLFGDSRIESLLSISEWSPLPTEYANKGDGKRRKTHIERMTVLTHAASKCFDRL